jgi:acetyl-CoA carboxylase biotin carboxyl carrier protein
MADDVSERSKADKVEASSVQLILKETKDLVRSLEGTAVKRIKVKAAGLDIEVERHEAAAPAAGTTVAVSSADAGGRSARADAGRRSLVGGLSRPRPPSFVEVGDTVERGQKVGIVEAMKMMNEVTTDFRGTVAEIVVQNGDTVQYEQTLMFIDVSGGK